MTLATSAAITAAASQSTVFVTVAATGGSNHGFANGVAGSLAGAVFGKTVTVLVNGSPTILQLSLTHGGTPLAQSFFRQIVLVGSNGTKTFSSSALGSTGSFTANSGGTTSVWVFSGTGIDAAAWDADDIAVVRPAYIFR